MKIKLLYILFLGFQSFDVFAQKPIPSTWIENIKIDGEFNDWKDTLQYYFKNQDFYYSVANDANYLYISVRVPNQTQQLKVIYSGFSISVNPETKKKDGPTIVFPTPDIAALRAMNSKENYEKTKNRREMGLNMVRAIHVKGFQSILDGKISLKNNYGIETAIRIDSANSLNYEAAISLSQLKINKAKPFSLNIRINEIHTSQSANFEDMRNRNPYERDPYRRTPNTQSGVISKTEPGVWHILELAKQ